MVVSYHLDRQFVNPTGYCLQKALLSVSWVQIHSTTPAGVVVVVVVVVVITAFFVFIKDFS